MQLPERQIRAVNQLAGPKRYAHFIKEVAEIEECWGLFSEGWALAATDDGQPVFPLWPAREYASLCASGNWADYEPEAIPLEELLSTLLPKLKEDNVLVGVFPTPEKQGVTPDIDLLINDLAREAEQYE